MLRTRVITALILAGGITTGILFFPTWAVGWLIGVFWLGGVWEWAGLTRLSGAARVGYLVVIGGLMLALSMGGLNSVWVLPIAGVAAGWWALALVLVGVRPEKIPLPLIGLVGPIVLLPAWFLLTHLHGSASLGPGLTLSILVIVWAADVGGYVVGRSWGRVKLAPRVSPGKTWEGLIGGLALAGGIAVAASVLLGIPTGTFVVIGIAAALASVVGDLTVSLFKRNVGVKDSGRLLPGHGGILDRIDSLAAATPIFALGLMAAGLSG